MLVTLLRIIAIAEVLKELGVDDSTRLRLCQRLSEYQHASINVDWLADELSTGAAGPGHS